MCYNYIGFNAMLFAAVKVPVGMFGEFSCQESLAQDGDAKSLRVRGVTGCAITSTVIVWEAGFYKCFVGRS